MTSILDEFKITTGWTELPFRAVARKVSESGFPELEPLSVFLDAGVVPRSSREDNHNQLGESLDKYQRVKPNDLVFNKLRTWQGGFGISDHEGIVSPAYIIARPDRSLIEPRFLGYLLKSKPYLAELTRLSKWMPPTQFDISWESIRDLKLRIPPISEQRKIADFLEAECKLIDIIFSKKLELINLLEENLQDAISQLLEFVPQQIKFKFRFSATSGNSISTEFIAANNLESVSGLPFISTKEVGGAGEINYDTEIHIPSELINGFKLAQPGAIFLCSEGGSAGKKFGLNSNLVAYGNKLFAITTKSQMSEKLLFFIFLSRNFQSQFRLGMNGMIGGISSGALGEILIPEVSAKDQIQLLSTLEGVYRSNQESIKNIESSTALLIEYRSSLITAAVMGQFDSAKNGIELS